MTILAGDPDSNKIQFRVIKQFLPILFEKKHFQQMGRCALCTKRTTPVFLKGTR